MERSTVVSLGMFAAWAVHDVEELITAPASSRRILPRMPRWLPIPADVRQEGFSRPFYVVAIGLMAGLMGAATADGVRSRGRGWLFQTVLAGFGLHGFGHVAASAASRSYTTGVATAPVVVVPFWLWARRALRRDGVPLRRVAAPATALTPAVIVGALGTARVLSRPRRVAD